MRRSSPARGRAFCRLFVVFALSIALLPAALPANAADADEIPFNSGKIVEFHNAERAARGLGGLQRDPRMDQHAQQVAESLAARGVLEHTPSVARSLGYAAGGQNLVFRAPMINASEAHFMWMTSDEHRRNILNPGFTHVGVGIACSRASGRVYAVAVVDFGGQGLFPEIPPQDPVAVGAGALQGHHIVCDGTSATVAPPPPPPAPPPPPPPAPAARPVVAKPAPVSAPPAPPAVSVPVPEPVASPEAAPTVVAAPPPPGPEPDEKPLARTRPVWDSERIAGGWTAFVAGCIGALMLAASAGGFVFRRQLAAVLKGQPVRPR